MKTKPAKELGLTSRISNAVPPTQNLGSLTPVHLDDVIKNRNLDYLEVLGELVQRTPATPIWYQYESTQNKMKFLQVYQYSINYGQNTSAIFSNILTQLNDEFAVKKAKVDKLKAEIISHKQKTSKLKRQFRKQKLIKQREKVLNYQKSLKVVRDNMKKQKKQLQAKNQEKIKEIQELRKKQQAQQETESKVQNPFAYLHQQPPYYQYYPHMPPPPYYQHHYPPPYEQGYQHIPSYNKIEESLPLKRAESSKQTFNPGKVLRTSEDIKRSLNQLKESKRSKQENINSDKTWTLGNSNALKQSNVESQKDDKVEELNERKSLIDKRFSIQNSKLSRRSSDAEDADIASFLDIQLKTQSKNDLEIGSKLQNKRSTSSSILGKLKNQKKIQQKIPSVDEVIQSPTRKVQYSEPKKEEQFIKKYDNNMSVKVTTEKPSSSITDASVQSSSSRAYGYLQQSNQGQKAAVTDSLFKGMKGIRLKQSGNIGRSIANSLQDVQSRNGSKLMVEDEQIYQDDFQTSGDLEGMTLTEKTRVKVNVDFSESSPEKQRNFEFVPLYKNYFVLKNEVLNMQKSKDKSQTAKSMKQFSVKFTGGSQKRKIQNKSQLGLEQNISGDMEEIDMPMNSIIAKPSKLKMSTIVRKSAIQKINKSHDPKVPATFFPESPLKPPIKEVRFADKTDVMDDNFAKIGDIESLKSVKVVKKDNVNLPPVPLPPKPEEKLANLQLAQSHVIEQQINEDQKSDCEKMGDDQSLDLSVIEESENQSLFTQQNSMKQKILLLIDKKYKQKGAAEFDKDIVKAEIQQLQKQQKSEELTWSELTDAFNQLSKKKRQQVNALIELRKNRAKTAKKKTSRQSSEKITKNAEKVKTNISKISQKREEEDDLMYSRSLLENPNSDNLHLKKKESNQIIPENKKEQEEKAVGKSKYIREQKETSNNRMLDKIIENSKFDQDDELENTIKANYRRKTEEKEVDIEDSF